jgi:hypothetical protein
MAQQRDKLMREALLMELQREDKIDGIPVRRLRRVANALIHKALDGDVAAIREINDRIDGKVAQQQIVSGDAENPLAITGNDMSDIELARRLAFILTTADKAKG